MITLKQQWRDLRQAQPMARARDFARDHSVSEAGLVASFCGDGAVRLTNYWPGIFLALPALGPVMALTRNEYAVHERRGTYHAPEFFGPMGQILGADIDLRLFTHHWHSAFAWTEETSQIPRRSLQFFDRHGVAIHKIHLQEASSVPAFEALVQAHTHPDQTPVQTILPASAAEPPSGDSAMDVPAFQSAWDALQDTHDFLSLLKKFGLTRSQALHSARSDQARRMTRSSLDRVLRTASASQLPIMIFVSNPGMLQIHTGPVRNILTKGPWLNVIDEDFNLHVREDLIHEAWVVNKPTRDGIVTSLELFAADGESIALLFGKRKPGQPESGDWRDLIQQLTPL